MLLYVFLLLRQTGTVYHPRSLLAIGEGRALGDRPPLLPLLRWMKMVRTALLPEALWLTRSSAEVMAKLLVLTMVLTLLLLCSPLGLKRSWNDMQIARQFADEVRKAF